jgi:PBP1b-binding outer membrane lipoprotein LpoB
MKKIILIIAMLCFCVACNEQPKPQKISKEALENKAKIEKGTKDIIDSVINNPNSEAPLPEGL